MKKLGIIAGAGALPICLVQACEQMKRPYFVVGLKGCLEKDALPKGTPLGWIRLGGLGKGFKLFKKNNVEEVVMIGAVRRPSFVGLWPDWKCFKMLLKYGKKALGDDALLKILIKEIEKEGFKVVGIDQILPHLLIKKGVYGRLIPTAQDTADIKRGVQVARKLGEVDVGQAVIVQQGLVLAVEGIEGTDALIHRSKALRRKGGRGVLIKVAKPQQDRRADLPTIGPNTVQSVAEAGLAGIAVQADSVLFSEAEKAIKLANQLGVFIIGVEVK
ncbi:MAG: UDP-2,3-diacylglucosamine diphosphatase LpxI [Alphaproteobacteria bacterium]|nr:UDP-2,3-diacylglucosamine diphosphatase LpxI [Alphaproteobacteria bacterium]